MCNAEEAASQSPHLREQCFLGHSSCPSPDSHHMLCLLQAQQESFIFSRLQSESSHSELVPPVLWTLPMSLSIYQDHSLVLSLFQLPVKAASGFPEVENFHSRHLLLLP